MSWIKRLVSGEGEWQTLFEHETSLDKKHIWELDPESLLLLGSKVSNNFWKEIYNIGLVINNKQYQKLTKEHKKFGVLILILIPVFYNVNKN